MQVPSARTKSNKGLEKDTSGSVGGSSGDAMSDAQLSQEAGVSGEEAGVDKSDETAELSVLKGSNSGEVVGLVSRTTSGLQESPGGDRYVDKSLDRLSAVIQDGRPGMYGCEKEGVVSDGEGTGGGYDEGDEIGGVEIEGGGSDFGFAAVLRGLAFKGGDGDLSGDGVLSRGGL